MQIVRLRADANLDTVTAALRSLNTTRNTNTRFALVKATIGEGEERAFLVEGHHLKDKDIGLLATAGRDKQIILSTKDAAGNEVRVTGKVYAHVKGGSPGLANWLDVGAAAGIVSAGWIGLVTALSGNLGMNPPPGLVFCGIVGTLAVFGSAVAFGRAVVRRDGADWARLTVDSLSEGEPVPVDVHGIEQAPAAVAALPPPTESPFVIPPVREKVPVAG